MKPGKVASKKTDFVPIQALSTAPWGLISRARPPSPSALVPGKNGLREIGGRDGSGSGLADRPVRSRVLRCSESIVLAGHTINASLEQTS